jgi:hypothetical protein
MVNRSLRNLALIAGGITAAWFAWTWAFPSDEAQIRSVLERISETISGGGTEGDVAVLGRAAALRSHLAPDVVVDAGAPYMRLTGRDAVIVTTARLNGVIRNLDVTFEDIEIAVADDRTSARATLVAEARYDERGGQRGFEARELELAFRRLDGRWVLSEVALIRALQPISQR